MKEPKVKNPVLSMMRSFQGNVQKTRQKPGYVFGKKGNVTPMKPKLNSSKKSFSAMGKFSINKFKKNI